MPRHIIEKIRDAIRSGNYDMTSHTLDEMAEEGNRRFLDRNSLRNQVGEEKCMVTVVNIAQALLKSE
jgi:hypothetical protein